MQSIYDAKTEYKIGKILSQPARAGHKGGYYVYPSAREAVFADIPFKKGGNFLAPRTVIKCICWGDFVVYGSGKMSFTNLLPVADLGLPKGYKANKDVVNQVLNEKDHVEHDNRERAWNYNLVKRNNNSREMYENNLFENYFSSSTVAQV